MSGVTFIVILWLSSFVSKLVSILVVIRKNPWKSIKAIPVNWFRAAMCTDIFCCPEFMPGLEDKAKKDDDGLLKKITFKVVAYNVPHF